MDPIGAAGWILLGFFLLILFSFGIRIIRPIEKGLIERLTYNYHKWGIDPDDREHILDTIMNLAELVLSRTLENSERRLLPGSGHIEKLSNYYTPKEKKSVV